MIDRVRDNYPIVYSCSGPVRIVIITRIKKSTSLLLAQSQQKKNTMDDDNLASILTAAVHYLKLRDVIHDGSKEKDKLQLHGKGGAAQTHSACFIEKRLLIAKTAAAMAAVGAAVGAMAVGAVGVGAVGVAVGAAVTLSSCILQPAFVGELSLYITKVNLLGMNEQC